MMVSAPARWVPWEVTVGTGRGSAEEQITDELATTELVAGGTVRVERAARRTTLTLHQRPDPGWLVHPLLSFTAVVAARWHGLQAFHAGAVVVDGRAWGVLGDKGAGKSSMLAALAQLGQPVLADDVTIVDQGRALAGPRAIDLRPSAAEQFPEAEPRGAFGGRERWRLALPQVAAETPLAGWVTLHWGEPELAPATPAQRLEVLSENLAVRLPPPDAAAFLELASLPMWHLSRPRDLAGLHESAAAAVRALRRAR